ncbi:MAG: Flp pilus assembly protein CpaB, partial [Alphaproteobacteria bacterium]
QAWPDEKVPDSYIVEGKQDEDVVVGGVVRIGIAEGEPISGTRVVQPGENGFLAALLNPGMRAITVPVNATTGISGFVFPGDRVDLILTHQIEHQDDGNRTRQASETVLSNVRILAIDQSTNDQGEEPIQGKTATLELTPKQAEIVTLITDLGRLSLSLRSLQPEGEALIRLAAKGGKDAPIDLLAQPKATREGAFTWDSEVSNLLPAGPDAIQTVQVVRGNESSELAFERGGRR